MRSLFIKYIDIFKRHYKWIGLENDILQYGLFYFYTSLFITNIMLFLFIIFGIYLEGFVTAFKGIGNWFFKWIFIPIYISITIKTINWIIDEFKNNEDVR